ncbi:ADP-heptose--LPS heptosyltransferase [Desulfosarcina alkanivorans]|jgi:heptosyltransferase-2|uniref:lipopolysaccharide heptosyltransferase II n=1 Tax=Desulfosarcina alkanivorans TaxID=571177 RepID=A0A5K7Z241_9BACT|nr:lipopolysaccharide heptosyltransferase II [Desulfosarcina alkanivorans]BBO72554.1 ADP-heptose--LPS heptosyltransferase [Desulfosarcina alkanivorans]
MNVNERKAIKRLLIRSTNWIGDAVMTTPAVRAIRRHFPGARISLLAKPWVAPVFAHSPHVDEIIVYEANGRHRGAMGPIRLARDLRRHRFDAAIFLQNAIEAALIAFLAGIPVRIGFDTDARRPLLTHAVRCTRAIKAIHQTGYYLEILKGIGVVDGDQVLELTLGENDREQARQLLTRQGVDPAARIVGLNPSATFGPAKQWFPERYAALGDRLRDEWGATVLIFGGPSDRELGENIRRMMHGPAIDLSGRTSLGQAMALIDRCDAFVTNDSGLMHVAAALNTPLVAIFGSTNSTTTSPHSDTSRIVRVPIECSPCMKPVCPLGHMNCMKQVSVELVFDTLKGLL